MNNHKELAELLAIRLVGAHWDKASLSQRSQQIVGKPLRWIEPFVNRLLIYFRGSCRPRSAEVALYLLQDEAFKRFARGKLNLYGLPKAQMHAAWPAAASAPPLCDGSELADWLGIGMAELDWFADRKCLGRNQRSDKLRHYHYRILAKPFGTVRLIESPKARLKQIQRQILRGILDHVAPHEAAHGFRAGRSIATFVLPHVGRSVVARLDLSDFFPRISRARVAALFRTIGYPEIVAESLAGLCTTVTPTWIWENRDPPLSTAQINSVRWLYGAPHLPQGSPTSPAIANLCAYRLDCRLRGLAESAGAEYTRYADDLAFSGDDQFARRAKRFLVHVGATAAEEGFAVHHRKTRVMRDGVRQHLAGIVVNRRPNVRRSEFDRLKAILFNCRRAGAAGQNRDGHSDYRSHLAGRIAFVEQIHPERGQRLRRIFEEIDWL